VALKVWAAENSSVDLASRLMQEAVVLARLEHPGVVPVHDAGTLPDGRTFYCMKHVEGQTFDQYVNRLPLRQRVQLFQRVTEPLAFAHSRGIIHRDLKPGNLMIGAFGEVLIMDWGLAKVMGASAVAPTDSSSESDVTFAAAEHRAAPSSGVTATAYGTILGTPGFMAPEQERGDVNLIDQRTDVFALGALLHYILPDKPGAPRSESAPRALMAICGKAMTREMSARYSSVQQLAADLTRYLDDMPVSAYRENIVERTVRLVNRNRVAVVLVLAYLFMRMLFIFFSRH
jgi:serine/threonine-protein kinase